MIPAPNRAAPALEATEQEEVNVVHNEEEAGFFECEDDDPFGSSLKIEQQLKEAQAKVDAAEARAQQAEEEAQAKVDAAEARAQQAEDDAKKWMRAANEATARAVAAEGRAGKAEALSAEYEVKLTTMCDLNDKLSKKLSSTASSSSMAGSSSAVQSAGSKSAATVVPPKPRAEPRHAIPLKSATVQANDEPSSPTSGPIGRVDGGEDAELRRIEAGEHSSLLPAAELPAAVPPAAKPLAAKRTQPSTAEPVKKSPRLVELAAARPSKCYFDGLELDCGEYRCTRDPIVSSSKMQLCSAPNCLAGPDACSAAAFHPFCYFDYYCLLGQFSLSRDFTPFQCPACEDPAKSH